MASYEPGMFDPKNPRRKDLNHYTTPQLQRFWTESDKDSEDRKVIEAELDARHDWRRAKQGKRTCYTCKYMDPGDGGRPGFAHGWTCRRRATDIQGWRFVTTEDWCGEWEDDGDPDRPALKY